MSSPPPCPSPPALLDDLIAEILLRLPPDEPACLFRASLVCKPWRRLLSDPAFLRRYRAFHRAPPVLGFLRNVVDLGLARFMPTMACRPPHLDLRNCYALDCRHGRALLSYHSSMDGLLLLWDPMTGEKQHVRKPDIPQSCYYNAAVLCATAGCDHLDCHGGPFLVAFVGSDDSGASARACLYSSEIGAWSAPSYVQLDCYVDTLPPVLVGDAIYFICESGTVILRYDLGGDRGLSVIDWPDMYVDGIALMPVEDGVLGLAGLDLFTVHLWSLKTDPDGVAGWAKRRVINLEMLLIPDLNDFAPYLIGFAKDCGSDIIFVSTDTGVFMIEFKSERATKVCVGDYFSAIFPYMSFCTPGCTSGRLPSPPTAQ